MTEVPFDDGVHRPPHEPTLDERAEAAAQEAVCTRCLAVILDEPSKAGLVFGRVLVPLLGVKDTFQLCGKCGLGLREYLYPEIALDPQYWSARQELLRDHW